MKSSRWSVLALSACVLAGTLLLPDIVRADSENGAPTEVVRFSDLNLDTAAGVRILYGRLQAAAGIVCEPLEPVGTLVPSVAWRSCIDQAIATAVTRVDRPLLTAYYARLQGHVTASGRQSTPARG
jgi:UrcA family protein